MTDTTPPLHPEEREELDAATTLVVTVRSDDQFHDDVAGDVEALERGDRVDGPPTVSFASYDDLLETLTPRVLDLLEAIQSADPGSINETARVVDRDVKNVHGELERLARLGIVYFEENGRAKRPVVWFDELVISLPFEPDAGDAAGATP